MIAYNTAWWSISRFMHTFCRNWRTDTDRSLGRLPKDLISYPYRVLWSQNLHKISNQSIFHSLFAYRMLIWNVWKLAPYDISCCMVLQLPPNQAPYKTVSYFFAYHGGLLVLEHWTWWSSCSCTQCSWLSFPLYRSCDAHCRHRTSQTVKKRTLERDEKWADFEYMYIFRNFTMITCYTV